MQILRFSGATLYQLFDTFRSYFRFDAPLILFLAVHTLLFVPLIPRATENALMLAAFVNDEPALTMALDAMTTTPFGNPANYYSQFDGTFREPPEYWHSIRYHGFTYYGGAYLGLGFLVFAPLKVLGVSTFPAAAIILRSLSFLASFLSLVLLYNYGKRHVGGVIAASFAMVVLLTDTYFAYYTMIIHPDTLQLCLSIFALLVAIRHAEHGDLPSLAALGVVAGLVQGTKVGGPWLIPMAFLAMYWGLKQAQAASETGTTWVRFLRRAGLLGVSALSAYFISTPYAFLDSYYFDALFAAWDLVTISHFGHVVFFTWMDALRVQHGSLLFAGLGATLLVLFIRSRFGDRNKPAALAATLALCNILWYTSLGKIWIQLGYLLPALGLLSLYLGDLVVRAGSRLPKRHLMVKWPATLVAVLVLLCLIHVRWFAVAQMVATNLNYQRYTTVQVGRWAEANIPHGATLFWDDIAYFDPKMFPQQRMHGGIMKHVDLISQDPDYFILCSSIFNSAHYQKLRKTQNLEPEDSYPYSVRLYQDLLDRAESPLTSGPTAMPGVELVGVIEPTPLPADCCPEVLKPLRDAFPVPAALWATCHKIGYIRYLLRLWMGREEGQSNPFGCTLMVYKRNPPGGPNGRAAPISSGDLEGYKAVFAFDGSGSAWNSRQTGEEVNGNAYIGYDFGGHQAPAIRKVEIRWTVPVTTPAQINVQFSDDGDTWSDAGKFAPTIPQDESAKFFSEVFAIGDVGGHRFWRVIATASHPWCFGLVNLDFSE